jgi:hypothetical protein
MGRLSDGFFPARGGSPDSVIADFSEGEGIRMRARIGRFLTHNNR